MPENNKEKELLDHIVDLELKIKKLKDRKTYGLVWENKIEKFDKDSKDALPFLEEREDKYPDIITNKNENFNILIEGDNYHSLSVLSYTHKNKIDIIYIDPPYNTGNKDFIYNDHYVDKEDRFRHSKWLSFISKRLKLAKALLKKDGMILISIDDNECTNLKLLCDDIFGADNFAACAPRKTGAGAAATRSLSELRKLNDFVLVYKKSSKTIFQRKIVGEKEYDLEDKHGKFMLGQFQASGSDATRKARPNMWYPIFQLENDELTTIEPKKYKNKILPEEVNGEEGRWLWGKEKFEKDKAKLLYFDGTEISRKIYYEESKDQTIYQVEKAWLDESKYQNSKGTIELNNILGRKGLFNNPKPVELIKFLINLHPNKFSVILDFFAGSGTTGHAVMMLNKEDKDNLNEKLKKEEITKKEYGEQITQTGNRKFILCTNNENKICEDVCFPRIEKVIKGYKNIKGEEVSGLGGNLKYLKTDFIKLEKSIDYLKHKIVEGSTEILCLKEGSFYPVLDNYKKNRIKVFQSQNRYTAILFDLFYFEDFIEQLKKLKDKPVSVYVFSYTKDFSKKEFGDLGIKFTIEAIPEKILETYKTIFNF